MDWQRTIGMDFNTSHVSINLISIAYNCLRLAYFNTSHVSINPTIDLG